MGKLKSNKVGLTLGVFCALIHAVWALLVAIGSAKLVIDLVMPLHFLSVIYSITEFSIATASVLVILAFAGGYITGAVFAWVWNLLNKK
ncbi:MAG: hypothetical protein KKA64_03245 [Nanoarchaeota archaeon]|nr:hypothetical protein [Nanoarchaeota archaeon]